MMTERPKPRIVYSTDAGRMCPSCSRPVAACLCGGAENRSGSVGNTSVEAGKSRPVARLRVETKGRGGKTVTVIDGLPRDRRLLEGLARELKRACGTGGSVGDESIELQGDRREKVRELLAPKGFRVKG